MLAALTVLVLIGIAFLWLDKEAPASEDDVGFSQVPAAEPTVDAAAVALAEAQLRGLPIEAESNLPYDRDSYGPRWADVESNGCNQRDDRLLLDAIRGTVVTAVQGECDHDVLAGHWIDPYTGRLLVATDLKDQAQAMSITIDHLVPLAQAHRSGAVAWTDARRLRFANDLPSLRVVGGAVNSSKSDQDPASWLPGAAAVCWYATVWIGVKAAWQLSIDPAEDTVLHRILDACSGADL